MSEQLELFPQEELQQEVNIPEAQPIADAERCIQFFKKEPIVFACSNKDEEPAPLVLQLQPVENEGLNFQQNGMSFRIFPRPISEETIKERDDASQNKEA